MKMGSQRVELNAINMLSSILLKTGYIIPLISKGDTTPSWDGELLLYPQKFSDKKDNLRKIPVQVKGRSCTAKSLKKNKTKFDVHRKDLVNFELNGGAIFFLVYMSDFDKYRIYYNALTPFDLQKLLSENNDEEMKLIFKALPTDTDIIVDICISFFENSKKQCSIKKECVILSKHFQKFDEYNFSLYSLSKNKLDSIFHTPLYLYGKVSGIPVALEKIDNIDSVEISSLQDIKIGEHIYSLKVSTEKTINKSPIIKVGPCFVFEKDKWSFNLKGTLTERIQAVEMLIDIKQHNVLYFETFKYTISDESIPSIKIDNIKNDLDKLIAIKNALEYFGVYKEIDLDSLSRNNESTLGFICHAYEHNGILSSPPTSNRFAIIECGNVNIAIHNKLISDKEVKLINAFDMQFAVCEDNIQPIGSVDESIITGCSYFKLNKEDIISLSNINYQNLHKGLIMLPPSSYENYFYNQIVLEMIKAFDSTNNIELLNLCIDLSAWIMERYPNPENMINNFQCIYRQRALTESERLTLIELKHKNADDIQIMLAISILLDNLSEYNFYFSQLSDDKKNSLKEWPIYFLYQATNDK